MSSQLGGSMKSSHKKSTIYVTGIAGLDNAAGYVRYNVSRKLSERDFKLCYQSSRKERQTADGFPTHLRRQDRVNINYEW